MTFLPRAARAATASWSTRSVRFETVVERLTTFPDPLPEPAAVLLPVILGAHGSLPREARWPVGDRPLRPAGVLVLLYPDSDGIARIVLTERASRDGHHSGEVSLPGGKAEAHDVDLAATALREATEEVGLDVDAAGVRVVGLLERFVIPVSDFDVTPVVAIATRRPILVPSEAEVARIVEPAVSAFLPDAPITIVERTIDGWPLRYGAYDLDGLSVWGATARILSQLGAVLAG